MWPAHDPKIAAGDTFTVAVQVNGKLRATFEARRGSTEAELQQVALEQPNVQKHLEGKNPKRVIAAKGGSLINVVI